MISLASAPSNTEVSSISTSQATLEQFYFYCGSTMFNDLLSNFNASFHFIFILSMLHISNFNASFY